MTSMSSSWLLKAIAFAFTVASLGATASAQGTNSTVYPKPAAQAQKVPDRKPQEAKPLAAEYDMFHIVKKLTALEAQVAELTKKSAALESQIAQMKLKDSIP